MGMMENMIPDLFLLIPYVKAGIKEICLVNFDTAYSIKFLLGFCYTCNFNFNP